MFNKKIIFSVSLANLIFLNVWIKLLYTDISQYYFMHNLPTINSDIAVLLNVSICAGCFWGIIKLIQKLNNHLVTGIAQAIFILLLLIPVYSVYTYKRQYINNLLLVPLAKVINIWGIGITYGASCILIIPLLIRYHRLFFKAIVMIILILAPFSIITFGQAMWHRDINRPEYRNQITTDTNAGKSEELDRAKPRILWLIFDEMDQRLTFENRPGNIQIPEFERLLKQSITSVHAYPPADNTLKSIPSLLTGKTVVRAEPYGPGELLLTYAGESDNVKWSEKASVFSEAKKLGFKTALVGWYHPYSRIFGDSLDYCSWYTGGYEVLSPNSVIDNMIAQVRSLIPITNRQSFIETHISMQQDTIKIAQDPDYGLIFIHLVGFHTPYVYDRDHDKYVLFRDSVNGYFDQMVLADQTLGRIHNEMESRGLWDSTTVIVSADHWWRNSKKYDGNEDHRVPFIVKLAGQNEAIVYNQQFNTVWTSELVLEILRGSVKSPKDVTVWLNQHNNSN